MPIITEDMVKCKLMRWFSGGGNSLAALSKIAGPKVRPAIEIRPMANASYLSEDKNLDHNYWGSGFVRLCDEESFQDLPFLQTLGSSPRPPALFQNALKLCRHLVAWHPNRLCFD